MDLSSLIMSAMLLAAFGIVAILFYLTVLELIRSFKDDIRERNRKRRSQLASLETRQWILEMRMLDLEMEQYHRRGKRRGGRR